MDIGQLVSYYNHTMQGSHIYIQYYVSRGNLNVSYYDDNPMVRICKYCSLSVPYLTKVPPWGPLTLIKFDTAT